MRWSRIAGHPLGDGEHAAFEGALWEAGLPYVVAMQPSKGTWAPVDQPHTPKEAAEEWAWHGPEDPGAWTPVERRFRDGPTETWWAADVTWAGYGPEKAVRLVVATTNPATLPEQSTWYLATNLPAPGSSRTAEWPVPVADLAEVVRLYGLRNWVEVSYKQVQRELGWADFQVREDHAIRRHWELVCTAFCFCWWEWFRQPQARPTATGVREALALPDAGEKRNSRRLVSGAQRAELPTGSQHFLAGDAAAGAGVVGPMDAALAVVASVEPRAPAARGASVA